MNVSLTPELEKLIHEKVAEGMFNSASEVVRDAMRYWVAREKLRQLRFEELRKEIAIGVEQLERGECREFDPERLKRDIRKRAEEMKKEEERSDKPEVVGSCV